MNRPTCGTQPATLPHELAHFNFPNTTPSCSRHAQWPPQKTMGIRDDPMPHSPKAYETLLTPFPTYHSTAISIPSPRDLSNTTHHSKPTTRPKSRLQDVANKPTSQSPAKCQSHPALQPSQKPPTVTEASNRHRSIDRACGLNHTTIPVGAMSSTRAIQPVCHKQTSSQVMARSCICGPSQEGDSSARHVALPQSESNAKPPEKCSEYSSVDTVLTHVFMRIPLGQPHQATPPRGQ